MNRTEWLILALLLVFIGIVFVVFRGRRWQGALGWSLIVGGFMTSVVRTRQDEPLISLINVIIVVIGMILATYDYVRFERPKRRQRREQALLDGPPPLRRPRRFSLRRRRLRHRQEQNHAD